MLIHKKLSRGNSLSRERIGNGPLRFAPVEKERGIKDQINALNPSERSCFDHLKQKWEKKYPDDTPFSNEMLLRFLRCSPGEAFHERPAWKVMKGYPQRCRNLTAASLEHQLRTKTIFPIPFLRTGGGYEVCYVRPCRVIAKPAAVIKEVLDSMAYTLGTMMENELPCTNGICVMFNMDGFGMSNFATDYWFNLMSMLQGKIVPLRVNNLLIVNAPDWFGNIWNLTKPMITLEFQAKVRMVSEEELSYYLAAGYEEFLPDEMETGQTSTDGLVDDFITYRKSIEGAFQHPSSRHLNSTPNAAGRGGKLERRNSFSSLNVVAAAATATFESFAPKNPARRRNSICSSPMCDDSTASTRAVTSATAKPAQRRRNSIACSFGLPSATTTNTTTSTGATSTKPFMQRRRNSLSSATAYCSSPITKNRPRLGSTGIILHDSPPNLRKPLMQRRRSSISTSSSQGSCTSPNMQNHRYISARGIDSPTDSPNKRWNQVSAVCDSPSLKRRNSMFSTVPTHGDSSPRADIGQQAKQRINMERQTSFRSSILAVASLDMNLCRDNSKRSVDICDETSTERMQQRPAVARVSSAGNMKSVPFDMTAAS